MAWEKVNKETGNWQKEDKRNYGWFNCRWFYDWFKSILWEIVNRKNREKNWNKIKKVGKIILKKIILILALICMIVLPIFGQTGGTNKFLGSNIVKCADYDHPDDAITAIGASNKTLLVTKSETCNTNFTVPANVTVKFERGGKWTINNGITVTSNGQLNAGLWQIFSYTGTGTLVGTPIIKEVYPQKWATGDGTVENPWANDCIQKAYDFVLEGGTIFLKAGYYELSNVVTLSKKVNIVGDGIDKTTVITADANGFTVTSDYCSLKDFTVDGDAQTDGVAGRCSIRIFNANYLFLENIKVKNAGYYGMSVVGSHSTFRNIYAVDNYRHGIHPGDCQYNVYETIYCWDNGINGFDDSGGDNSSSNIYDSLYCWNNGDFGIALIGQSGGSLINSLVYNNGDRGIYIGGVYNFTIQNCFVHSNYRSGIYIGCSDNINLSNVITKNNSTSNTTNDSGIHIIDTPSIKLSLCQSYDDRDSPLQDCGIRIEGTTKYVEITNCEFIPNEKYAILNHANAIIFLPLTLNLL